MNSNDKFIAVFVLILSSLTEWGHLPFDGVIHSYYIRNGIKTVIYLSDMIYYFFNESMTLAIVIIILIKLKGNPAKSIMSGIVLWFFIEWVEICLQLAKIDDSRLFINNGAWLQLSTCLTISLLVLFGSKKLTS